MSCKFIVKVAFNVKCPLILPYENIFLFLVICKLSEYYKMSKFVAEDAVPLNTNRNFFIFSFRC